MSALCITVIYHPPNRWVVSYTTAVPLIKARFLTLIVGDRAKRCGDVPSTVSQPPEILKASTLCMGYSTNLHSLFNSHHVYSVQHTYIHDHTIIVVILLSEKKRRE